ncbi:MAG: hypothetical protein ACE5FO_01340 [Parvularculaceae bacterium]
MLKSRPKSSRSMKSAILAAASATAALAAFGGARAAAPPDIATFETAPVSEPEPAAASAPKGETGRQATAPRWILWAGAAAALAALVRIVGANRALNLLAGAGPAVAKAAGAAARAPLKAAKAVGDAAAAPFRFALMMGGLALFAFTGVSLFDLQWAGGLAAGMALVALAWWGAAKTRRAFRFAPARTKRDRARDPQSSL